MSSPCKPDDKPELLADQTFVVTDGWRQLPQTSWEETSGRTSPGWASSSRQVSLVLQMEKMPNLLSAAEGATPETYKSLSSDKSGVQSGKFFFAQAIETTKTVRSGNGRWLAGPGGPVLTCFLDVSRSAGDTTGDECASRACEALALRCQSQRRRLRVSGKFILEAI